MVSESVSGLGTARRTSAPCKSASCMMSAPRAGAIGSSALLPFRAQQAIVQRVPTPEIALYRLAHAHFEAEAQPLDKAHGARVVFVRDGTQPVQSQFVEGIIQDQGGGLPAIALTAVRGRANAQAQVRGAVEKVDPLELDETEQAPRPFGLAGAHGEIELLIVLLLKRLVLLFDLAGRERPGRGGVEQAQKGGVVRPDRFDLGIVVGVRGRKAHTLGLK